MEPTTEPRLRVDLDSFILDAISVGQYWLIVSATLRKPQSVKRVSGSRRSNLLQISRHGGIWIWHWGMKQVTMTWIILTAAQDGQVQGHQMEHLTWTGCVPHYVWPRPRKSGWVRVWAIAIESVLWETPIQMEAVAGQEMWVGFTCYSIFISHL